MLVSIVGQCETNAKREAFLRRKLARCNSDLEKQHSVHNHVVLPSHFLRKTSTPLLRSSLYSLAKFSQLENKIRDCDSKLLFKNAIKVALHAIKIG